MTCACLPASKVIQACLACLLACLLQFRQFVDLYAKDQDKFFDDFAKVGRLDWW
jgi:hypothetical protein